MDLWQMRYFIQICNDQSFTKAAKSLYITEQGLSKAIKNIEDEFQTKLFECTSKGVKPTIYGELLLDKSQKILIEYDDMVYAIFKKTIPVLHLNFLN